jgi:hypothetical protein
VPVVAQLRFSANGDPVLKTQVKSGAKTKAATQSKQNVARQTEASSGRRFRPLGLSIAILAAAGLYGFLPLIPAMLVLLAIIRGYALKDPAILSGTDFNDPMTWINTVLSLATLVACVLAWRGRPVGSRRFLLVLVWLGTVLRLIVTVQSLTVSQGYPSNINEFFRPIALCQTPFLLIVPLYITWYLNRAPARAFYQPLSDSP